jgi:hypothetical protein
MFLRDRFRVVRDDDADDLVADGERMRVPLALMDGGGDRPRDALAGRRPGYATPDADQVTMRKTSRAEMIRASQDAWMDARRKKPPPDPDPDPDPDEDDDDDDVTHAWEPEFDARDARACARRSYDAMCARLRDGWRTPPTQDFAQPDQSTTPAELALLRRRPLPHDDPEGSLRNHLSTGPGPIYAEPDAQKRRDAAWQGYTSSLSEAWKTPRHALVSTSTILGAGPIEKAMEPGRADPGAASRIERVRERTHGGK